GSNARELAPVNSLAPELAWSPDGKAMAFLSAPSGHNEVLVMKADGSDMHPAAAVNAADLNFAWSPDGRQILVESKLTGRKMRVLMLIDIAAKTRKTIVDDAYCGRMPAWMPTQGSSF